ncbi:NADPH-dependent 7-cyano-7-deazaguanine reductase QueF [Hahella sp. KA22]|uniref:NADPH-dependent 7-cyano-7-deazaguanine reductase QueF n=1 Tax=Hahella sp. KA22 TaxID=1628392 RepID=UPI000FDDB5DB|nr:NADPH-dependent 7-cyano-7-deazaguanine reductase QueF [Hahella sp. KA22]AZZ93343.1 NADPH-dependent 7-cyano-7-deazaguanine reductase QueF [Hahella sp. KA22]QAY56717.1 NADPH-dependent 7-cyano-7-deazaguanine reductase QueF [Hahella sp. KA22]
MELEKHTHLGKATEYPEEYSPSWLTPIPRAKSRGTLGLSGAPDFVGEDLWNGYELSWLNSKGKPEVALGVFRIRCDSLNIIESKSFKLYLNSFNQSRFASREEVQALMQKDLSAAAEGEVSVTLLSASDWRDELSFWQAAENLDGLDIEVEVYTPDASLLPDPVGDDIVEETLSSDLLKSNCPVTGQPDWATLYIHYRGKPLDKAALLKYIVSMRSHQDFHEHCVESVYLTLMQRYQPEKLAVYARYTRRGGLDINPLRSNYPLAADNFKLPRQ